MKHLALTAIALLANTLPGMAGHLRFGELDHNHIAALSIIMVFGLPVFIVAILLYFSYKNKQAKYKLASEALAAGKEVPESLFKNNPQKENVDVLQKGIKNVFLGIGLGVFLWVLTEERGIAAIGFLIFCIGMGQVVIAYVTRERTPDIKSPNKPFIQMHEDKDGTRHIKVGSIEMKREKNDGNE